MLADETSLNASVALIELVGSGRRSGCVVFIVRVIVEMSKSLRNSSAKVRCETSNETIAPRWVAISFWRRPSYSSCSVWAMEVLANMVGRGRFMVDLALSIAGLGNVNL